MIAGQLLKFAIQSLGQRKPTRPLDFIQSHVRTTNIELNFMNFQLTSVSNITSN